jgi:alginate O-acetyltransferase complex protein AlgI
MLFNSYEFILLFLPLAVSGFFLAARVSRALAASWLCLASLFFYGWWNANFVGLLIGSVLFNFTGGWAIGAARKRSPKLMVPLLAGAVVLNLAVLGYFKYVNFFISTIDTVAGANFGLLAIILPLGISFFTFTQIAFLVDVYHGITREYNFIHYALFVTYFPHLIAGPLLHHKQMMPQFESAEVYRADGSLLAAGMMMFTMGLAKKVLIADSIAGPSSTLFNMARDGEQLSLVPAWVGALAYTFQLYFDFSGYCDMAIGSSLLIGIRLPLNFNSPYKADSIIEFWRRWHMTLAIFLRDYLYIPLGGNRRGPWRRYLNLMITMLLGGLWHGANWTFVMWGGLHGIYLIINHVWRRFKVRTPWAGTKVGRAIAVAMTFLAVVVGWVMFRADSPTAAESVLRGMIGLNGVSLDEFADYGLLPLRIVLAMLAFCSAIVFACPNSQSILAAGMPRLRGSVAIGLGCGVVAALCMIVLRNVKSEFLYFQF